MSTQTAQSNVEIARLGYDAWNSRDFDRGASLFADDAEILNIPLGTAFRGKDGYLQFVRGWAAAFSDGKIDIDNIVVGDTAFAVEFTARGTHDGALKTPAGDLPPTGKKVELRFCDVGTIHNGKIISIRSYFDSATLMRQLGLA
jgi:steroid delta-isomerase-like uncharacterized protein